MCAGPASFTSVLEEGWGSSCKIHLSLGKPHILYLETQQNKVTDCHMPPL